MSWDLNAVWFILSGLFLTVYAVLDGFDLGVGALYLFARKEEQRQALMKAIAPVWDGNEVWLVVAGAALFAAFPEAYATAFSGFYTTIILLLFALIFRAVSLEFRNQRESAVWRKVWDAGFGGGSIAATLLMGIALGNIAYGVPLNEHYEFTGRFFTLLRPYPLLVGITTLALFAMHGALYLTLKTKGKLQEEARFWALGAGFFYCIGFLLMIVNAAVYANHMFHPFVQNHILLIIPIIIILAIYCIIRWSKRWQDFRAFLASVGIIIASMVWFGMGIFPYLVRSKPKIANSLDIYNAGSSPYTLKIMLIIALLGMPLVIAYTVWIYWVFRGKVGE